MKKQELLDNILAIIGKIREEQEPLQKVYDFLINTIEIEPEEIDFRTHLTEKQKNLIKEVADYIDTGMDCYINPKTATFEYLFSKENYDFDLDLNEYTEKYQNTVLEKIGTWEKHILIEPFNSHEGYELMENFALFIQNKDTDFSIKLQNILQRKRPFSNFKNTIDNSLYRQDWFDYKDAYLQKKVFKILKNKGMFA